jgi:hypothetical protein
MSTGGDVYMCRHSETYMLARGDNEWGQEDARTASRRVCSIVRWWAWYTSCAQSDGLSNLVLRISIHIVGNSELGPDVQFERRATAGEYRTLQRK